ncbi:LysR substrate-binding domain-containing protein [Beijerinckia sp. L45]|uniref:LysR substrate-binding domain-containing protein n=1 Tax=Beijerinckia sp. L45 TaxID=1641855 RepID=UPI00131E2C65|nr:LysR substrate-binding domain-containing protein [Beijerinckia sp. L45]
MIRPDLDDLFYFAEVVAHGGFAPAGRATGLPKSKLSRRITALEGRLGIRLIERSTRRFKVTDVGLAFYDRCRAMLREAEAAQAIAAEAHGEPHGTVRFSCPPGMLRFIAPIFPDFLARHPGIRLQILSTNDPVDLIAQRIDVAMRLRTAFDREVSLTMKPLAASVRILVASPALAATIDTEADIGRLATLPTIGSGGTGGEEHWTLVDGGGADRAVDLAPRMTCGDISTLRSAAAAGVGVAFIFDHACRKELADGSLVRVFPRWSGPAGTIHLVFTTRRGQARAVRAFIDHLTDAFRRDILQTDEGRS